MDLELVFECDESWDDMLGNNDRQRMCTACDKQVYNLVGLTERQAERVLREHAGDVCARFRRIDGIVAFADDPRAQLADQHNGLRALVLAAAIPLATLGAQFHVAVMATDVPPCATSNEEPGYGDRAEIFVERFFTAHERDEASQEVIDFLSFGLTRDAKAKFEHANDAVVSGGVEF